MRKVFKWIGIVLGVLVGVLVLAVAVVYTLGTRRLTVRGDLPGESFTTPTSAEARARGEYLMSSTTGCTGCHGENLGGTEFLNDPAIGLIWAPNLTAGQGGVGATYTDADWELAIRHGVRPNGEALVIMPSHQFNHMSDEDLGAVLAYLKTFAPVDQTVPARRVALMGRVLIGAGMFGDLPFEVIDHQAGHPATVTPAVSPEYGAYVVALGTCVDCHGPKLDGVVTGGPPSDSPPPNLTPAGDLANWTEADFIQTIRTGVTPEGHTLSPEMPWMFYGNMVDQDLAAIFAYLKSLPPGP